MAVLALTDVVEVGAADDVVLATVVLLVVATVEDVVEVPPVRVSRIFEVLEVWTWLEVVATELEVAAASVALDVVSSLPGITPTCLGS